MKRAVRIRFVAMQTFPDPMPPQEHATEISAREGIVLLVERGISVQVNGREYPWAQVKHIDYPPPDPLECPECHETFADPRALGAHRKHRHGVKGGKAA